MKAVVCILSYNMPHLTDALYEQLRRIVKVNADFVVLDNGSLLSKVASSTTHRIEENRRLTGGMNKLLELASDSDFVWLCTNDIKFETDLDPLASMIEKCNLNENIGCIHPSLIKPVENYAYSWMLKTEKTQKGVTTGHSMVDIICPLYTRKALDLNGWKFDSDFVYGWGIDYDSCFILRQGGLQVAVDFDLTVAHQTSITYDSGNDRDFKNRQQYYTEAHKNMISVMIKKYGPNWRNIVC